MDSNSRVDEALEQVGLLIAKVIAENPTGLRQRMFLSKSSSLNKPELLFLDEPTSGLGLNISQKKSPIIKRAEGKWTTIFLTTHDMVGSKLKCVTAFRQLRGTLEIVHREILFKNTQRKTSESNV